MPISNVRKLTGRTKTTRKHRIADIKLREYLICTCEWKTEIGDGPLVESFHRHKLENGEYPKHSVLLNINYGEVGSKLG